MASGSSSLPWDFFSSRLLDLSPGSFRPHLSGSLALPTMTMTGTVGPVGPVGAVPTSRCSTGLPQSRGTSKGSRDLESPWPWPQSVQSVQLDQVFVAKSKNSRPSSQSLSLARAHFWKTWRLDGLTFHASSLGGGGPNGSIACSEKMFGGCWIIGWWLKDAEGCWRAAENQLNHIESNNNDVSSVEALENMVSYSTAGCFGVPGCISAGASCQVYIQGVNLFATAVSGERCSKKTRHFIELYCHWLGQWDVWDVLVLRPKFKKKQTDIVISSIHITINIHWSLYIYHYLSISLTFAVHPFWERAMSAGSGWPKGGGAPRKHPAFGSSVLLARTPGGEFSGVQRYIPIRLILNIYP